jgi:hypothetical protein
VLAWADPGRRRQELAQAVTQGASRDRSEVPPSLLSAQGESAEGSGMMPCKGAQAGRTARWLVMRGPLVRPELCSSLIRSASAS